MRYIFSLLFCAITLSSISQVDGDFNSDEFSEGQFSSGIVYAEMTAVTVKGKSVIEFDFGSAEESQALRKEALWDKDNNKELVFKSTIDALMHLEKIQWMARNVVVNKNGDEIFKYFLLEKMTGF